MGFVAPVAMGVGAITSLLGTRANIKAASKGAQAESDAAEYQARLEQQQAVQSQDVAAVKATEVIRDSNQELAGARAGALESGFALTGSINDLLDQSERNSDLDYLTAVYDGRVEAAGLQESAKMHRQQAKYARKAGKRAMGSAALTGISNLAGQLSGIKLGGGGFKGGGGGFDGSGASGSY